MLPPTTGLVVVELAGRDLADALAGARVEIARVGAFSGVPGRVVVLDDADGTAGDVRIAGARTTEAALWLLTDHLDRARVSHVAVPWPSDEPLPRGTHATLASLGGVVHVFRPDADGAVAAS